MCRFRPPFVSVPCSRIIHNVSRPSNDRYGSPRDRISSHRYRRRHERFYRARPSASHTHTLITDPHLPICTYIVYDVLFVPPPPSPMPYYYITSTTETSNTFTSTASGRNVPRFWHPSPTQSNLN